MVNPMNFTFFRALRDAVKQTETGYLKLKNNLEGMKISAAFTGRDKNSIVLSHLLGHVHAG